MLRGAYTFRAAATAARTAAARGLHTTNAARAASDVFAITVPEMGDSITEATVIAWEKQPGEAFIADEVILVLETDKVCRIKRL